MQKIIFNSYDTSYIASLIRESEITSNNRLYENTKMYHFLKLSDTQIINKWIASHLNYDNKYQQLKEDEGFMAKLGTEDAEKSNAVMGFINKVIDSGKSLGGKIAVAWDKSSLRGADNFMKAKTGYVKAFTHGKMQGASWGNVLSNIKTAFSKTHSIGDAWIALKASLYSILAKLGLSASLTSTITPIASGAIVIAAPILAFGLIRLIYNFIKNAKGSKTKEEAEEKAYSMAKTSLAIQQKIGSRIKDPKKKAQYFEQLNKKIAKFKAYKKPTTK